MIEAPPGATRAAPLLGSAAVLLLALGCPAGSTTDAGLCDVEEPILDHAAWTLTGLEDDPWFPPPVGVALSCEAPRQVFTEPFGELESLTVETADCNWATVEQRLDRDLRVGDELHARIWYFSQTRFEGVEAVLAFSVEDRVIAEWRVPVPVEVGSQVSEVFRVNVPATAGERLRFHVGNHGSNTWNLLELNAVKRGPCP